LTARDTAVQGRQWILLPLMNIPGILLFLASPYLIYLFEREVMYPFMRRMGRDPGSAPSLARYHVIALCLATGLILMYLGL
jgi:hypothetical protein